MGLWSWLRGVSEPDTGGTSAPSLPSGGEPSGRDAAAPPSDPGWRALPPVQRTLADGVHSVARLGDFAGSLATWQSPRMLTELEHGRGPSAPSGSAVGIVDATPGPPGVAELPVAGVPLSPLTTPSLPGSATAPVQREVRFDPPGRTALQTALSAAGESGSDGQPAGPLLGAPTVVQRSEGSSTSPGAPGLPPVAPSALPAPEAGAGSAAVGVPPAGSSASSSSPSSSSVPSSSGPTAR